jgi:Lrp/AsnC family transcriptional regulator for asnA, asnC and gidA
VSTGERRGRGVVLDRVDRAIVGELQRDGRTSFRTIATRVGVSEATVRNRYNALVEAGILQVTAVTDPLRLGYESLAMLALTTAGRAEEVTTKLGAFTEVSYVVITAGHADVLVELVCRDRRHLLETIERVRAIPEVVSAQAAVYLDLKKQQYDWRPLAD